MSGPSITVNTYGGSITGHTNVTFRDASGNHLGTYGANINIGQSSLPGSLGGVYAENPGRVPSYTHQLILPEVDFNKALFFAREQAQLTQQGTGEYSPIMSNCYDFVDDVLQKAGLPNNSAHEYMEPGSLVKIYGETQQFLMNPMFEYHFQQMVYDPYYQPITSYQLQWATYFIQHQGGVEYSEDGWEVTGKIQRVESETWVSPIVLDLDGDGFDFVDVSESNATFDFGNDGRQVHTAWIGSGDGFLVVDHDGDNRIGNLSEMFGGRAAGAAYNQLEEYDSDGNGLINNQDDSFGDLSIWRDLNGNGVSEDGELSSLSDNRISELNLDTIMIDQHQGDVFLSEGSSATRNGTDINMVDVFFRAGGLADNAQAQESVSFEDSNQSYVYSYARISGDIDLAWNLV